VIWLALAAVVGSIANAPPPAVPTTAATTLANPASVACVKDGGRVELVSDAVGNTNGICHRKDGRACEEWALFNSGQCALPPPAIPN
jgi:putative hemolysin